MPPHRAGCHHTAAAVGLGSVFKPNRQGPPLGRLPCIYHISSCVHVHLICPFMYWLVVALLARVASDVFVATKLGPIPWAEETTRTSAPRSSWGQKLRGFGKGGAGQTSLLYLFVHWSSETGPHREPYPYFARCLLNFSAYYICTCHCKYIHFPIVPYLFTCKGGMHLYARRPYGRSVAQGMRLIYFTGIRKGALATQEK